MAGAGGDQAALLAAQDLRPVGVEAALARPVRRARQDHVHQILLRQGVDNVHGRLLHVNQAGNRQISILNS